MKRILALSALLGLAMTGAAAAQTAEITANPVNGACPAGFELRKAASPDADTCAQSAGASGSGVITLANLTGGGHGDDHDDHDDDDEGHRLGSDHDSDHD